MYSNQWRTGNFSILCCELNYSMFDLECQAENKGTDQQANFSVDVESLEQHIKLMISHQNH